MSDFPILSMLVFLPLFSAFFITFFISQTKSKRKQIYAMYVAILSALLSLIASIYLLFSFDNSQMSFDNANFQFVEKYSWIDSLGLELYFGVDGISIYFIFLTSLLILICIIASLFTIKKNIKEFLLCFLLLEAFCIGAFSSLNLLLFYILFEVVLIPMYLVIGIWGGENKIYAAIKFFLYTFLGSIFLLFSIIYIYIQTGTFNMLELFSIVPEFSFTEQLLLSLAVFIAFAIKVPMLPFHTWLPDAHVQAPTSGSVILAGILLKFGGYGFVRIMLPMFPLGVAFLADYILYLSAFTIIYGSLVALTQTDMKKMIAYSSVAHMGYVTCGIFSLTDIGISGAVFQMISHGLISSVLFLVVGILYERNHTKEIAQYGGVAAKMPILASFFMIATLGSVGLPGLSGFIGEFMTIFSSFYIGYNFVGVAAAFGVVLGALYMLRLYKMTMFGVINNKNINSFEDLKYDEKMSILPLVILIIYLGIGAKQFVTTINHSTAYLGVIYTSDRDIGDGD